MLSSLVEKSIESLPNEQKAQVDLVTFVSGSGQHVEVPRWLLTKYPVVIAADGGSFRLVLPSNSRPKILEEGLPLSRYQLKDIVRIELASYHETFGLFYLKRRTDPVALRGEKLFVQNCTNCHSIGIEKSAQNLVSSGHPSMADSPRLQSRDIRALVSYFNAYRLENPTSGSAATSSKSRGMASASAPVH